MTTPQHDDSSLARVLQIYEDDPLDDGDAVLLFVDEKTCVEIPGLAAEWDGRLRENTAYILRRTGRRVQVAIARADQELLPTDFELWRDLHRELRDSDVELLPVRALPAA